ncbi:MAG: carbohydrate ABC transporter permease [Bacillota bacterium]
MRSLNVKQSKAIVNILVYAIMIIAFLIYLVPIWYIISTSFKLDKDAYTLPPPIIFKPTLANYITAFTSRGITVNFVNSLIISIISSVIAMIFGVMAAYALSRFDFKAKGGIYNWILSTRIAPPMVAAIPYFVLSRQIGIYDTTLLMIIVYVLINLSWVIWMMGSYFNDVPKEIDEASMVDGCNRLNAFLKVILPVSKPGLAAAMIFSLIMAWNEYFFALLLTSVNAKTLPAAITSFQSIQGLLLGQMCATGTVVMLPILVFSMFMQRELVSGLTLGAVKG